MYNEGYRSVVVLWTRLSCENLIYKMRRRTEHITTRARLKASLDSLDILELLGGAVGGAGEALDLGDSVGELALTGTAIDGANKGLNDVGETSTRVGA